MRTIVLIQVNNHRLFTSREVRIGKTVLEVLRPRAVLKTEGTVFFSNTDRPRLLNNIFIFFYNTTKGVRNTRTF